MMYPLRIAVLAIGVLAVHASAHAAAPMTETTGKPQRQVRIVPYAITYDISLLRAAERSGMLIASGKLTARLEGGVCEGWSSTSRMQVRFVFRREATRETESRVASWESDDGNRFYSRIERYLNGLPVETVRVRVERSRAGHPFHLEMTAPERRTVKLPPATLFPTAALKQLLLAAKAGERQRTFLLYEGDEEAAPQHVVALIGKKRTHLTPASDMGESADKTAEASKKSVVQALVRWPYWPVSLAYYGVTQRLDGSKLSDKEREAAHAGLPEYEVHFRLYENGVTGEAQLIYPDYVLHARPVRLKMLKAAACE